MQVLVTCITKQQYRGDRDRSYIKTHQIQTTIPPLASSKNSISLYKNAPE
uniref:Uncharacterized protein n=1 Tax=Anguilla anguilla TaxID=7936 RepID=A0A0E9XAS7_ANGAN